MKFGVVLLVLMLVGCKSNKTYVEHVYVDQMPACNVQELPRNQIIRAINIYEGTVLIENGDTTAIRDYTFHLVDDTLSLVHAFESVEIPDIIKETFTQGRVFLRTVIRNDSTFSSTTIVRGIGPYYQPVQQQIDRTLARFRVAEPPKDSVVLVFSHRIRLDQY